jgi:hypothetical protein
MRRASIRQPDPPNRQDERETSERGETRREPSRVGDLLRAWRAKRRLPQLEVGRAAGVSARHPSFIETGRARQCRAARRAG